MDISLDWLNQHKPGNTAKFFNLEFLKKSETHKEAAAALLEV